MPLSGPPHSRTVDSAEFHFSSSSVSSFIGGGQLGMNYEFGGGVVVGAEAMFDWLSNTPNNFTASNLRAGTASGTINNRWVSTVTAKLGYAWTAFSFMAKAAAHGSEQTMH